MMADAGARAGEQASWTLLTGHGHVLVEIWRDPDVRIRDISAIIGLTERSVQSIVADLEAAGYLTRDREGRRNRYTINPETSFRHSAQAGLVIGPFLDFLTAAADSDDANRRGAQVTPSPGGVTRGDANGRHSRSDALAD